MANNEMNVRHILRNATEEEWQSNGSSVPMLGEPCLTTSGTDKGKVKYGDGTTSWSSLPYSGGSGEVSTIESDVYDIVITSQQEWSEMSSSSTWNDVQSVAIKCDLTFTSVLKIPDNVSIIHGFNSLLQFKGVTANGYGIIYRSSLPTGNSEIKDLRIECSDVVTTSASGAFAYCKGISNVDIEIYNASGSAGFCGLRLCSHIQNVTIKNYSSLCSSYGLSYCDYGSNISILIQDTLGYTTAVSNSSHISNIQAEVYQVEGATSTFFLINNSSYIDGFEGKGAIGCSSNSGVISRTSYSTNISCEVDKISGSGSVLCLEYCYYISNASFVLATQTEDAGTSYGIHSCANVSNITLDMSGIQVYAIRGTTDSSNITATVSATGESTSYGIYEGRRLTNVSVVMVCEKGAAYGVYTLYGGSGITLDVSAGEDSTATIYGGRYFNECSGLNITVQSNGAAYGIYTCGRVSALQLAVSGKDTVYGIRSGYYINGYYISVSTSTEDQSVYGLYSCYRMSDGYLTVVSAGLDVISYALYICYFMSNMYVNLATAEGVFSHGSQTLSNIQFKISNGRDYTGTNLYIDSETVVEV